MRSAGAIPAVVIHHTPIAIPLAPDPVAVIDASGPVGTDHFDGDGKLVILPFEEPTAWDGAADRVAAAEKAARTEGSAK